MIENGLIMDTDPVAFGLKYDCWRADPDPYGLHGIPTDVRLREMAITLEDE